MPAPVYAPRTLVPAQRSSLIAGRLVPRECVTWSNHELTERGFKPVATNLNIQRTEIDCLYVNGEEVRPTAKQILDLQEAILADKSKKAKIRSEKSAKKKAVKDKLDKLEKGESPTDIPPVTPDKKSKRSSVRSKKDAAKAGGSSAVNSDVNEGLVDVEVDATGDATGFLQISRQSKEKEEDKLG